MAVSVSITNSRRSHQLVTAAIGAVTTWQVISLPAWAKQIEIVNFGTDSIFLSSDVADGAVGSGGVELPSRSSYAFKRGAEGAVIAVRHASGTYTFGLHLEG